VKTYTFEGFEMDQESNDIDDNTLQSTSENDQSADHDQQYGSESATDSEPEHDENAEGEEGESKINQNSVNDAISRQHAKYREEQRKSQRLETELQQYRQSNQQQSDPEPGLVKVDPYDDNVEEQLKQRDDSIRAHIQWQNRQAQRTQQAQNYQQQSYQQQQQEAAKQTDKFFENAKHDGVDQQKLNEAIQTVGQYQLGQEVANYLLGDDRGHHVTIALGKNPTLLADLSLMTSTERILHIERNVRPRVAKSEPRRSKGSRPPTRVKGRASDVSDKYPLTGGKVTIE
jgi:hypothetical protein|tara:strand:+ start:117 stop:977 length:861 start_codon:yes stop_codon:yes gene_type:complete